MLIDLGMLSFARISVFFLFYSAVFHISPTDLSVTCLMSNLGSTICTLVREGIGIF